MIFGEVLAVVGNWTVSEIDFVGASLDVGTHPGKILIVHAINEIDMRKRMA